MRVEFIIFRDAFGLWGFSPLLGAMFFGLIHHDRLNYVAIKTEKCPARGLTASRMFLQFNVFPGKSTPIVESSMFHRWKFSTVEKLFAKLATPHHFAGHIRIKHHTSHFIDIPWEWKFICEIELRDEAACCYFAWLLSVMLFFFFSLLCFCR